ncbi:MAG: NAD(P)-binding protein [Planctomycetota bacterium]|jgi:uncharacterized FAD-dependent dehydrogenase|nr:NAD(P)-binding protein [Planctomycetota bacterium]
MTTPLRVSIDQLEVDITPHLDGRRVSVDHHLHDAIACHLGIARDQVHDYTIDRRSLDARHKPRLNFIYRLEARVSDGSPVREGKGVTVHTQAPDQDQSLYHLKLRDELPREPVVVGTGPAGIMAAYLLALHGCRPLVLDRGRDVSRRGADVEQFHRSRELNPNSNFLFGEGGAGTYSDGKLYTRVKDRRMRFLLEAFAAARAPREILYVHHPHIGSDILPHMARRMRAQIEAWGGRFRWEAEVSDIIERDGRCAGVVLSDGEQISADCTLIAPGHSARALIRRLLERNLDHKAKGFQLGCRIEHDQRLINTARYGCVAPPKHLLTAAEYNLVSRPPKHLDAEGVTTFCMCPGGEIICATSDTERLSTNGMSRHHRGSPYANAGLICNQSVDRDNALAGFDLIEQLERAAFTAGGGDYSCPAQSAFAFLRGEDSAVQESSYRLGVRPGRIDQILPKRTVKSLREALKYFERRIPGFLKNGNLVGVETRVSSPVRFERDPDTLASSLPGLYLGGEGAGYAGGIVSAGLDGLRLAETILTGIAARRER